MSNSRILVVEDDQSLLEGIRVILELEEFEVLMAENGADALRILRGAERLPELILSDIMMPRMDGLQLLQEIRKEPAWVSIPFIFLTAKGERTDIQTGKRLGVDDYLVKPFEADDLIVAINSRLNRHRAIRDVQVEQVASLKRNILTILNHEFRTPLTFVVAYSDLLNTQAPDELTDAELLSFLKGVSTGASRLRRLIENFILLVELETGDARRTFEWRKSVISDVEQMFYEVFERVMQAESVDFTYIVQIPQPVPHFAADREYLTIALCQLVNNAVKFSERDKPIVLGAGTNNGYLYLWVQDEGRGIPEAELESIWDTFYQVNRKHNEDQGTGSGLNIVKGIAALHGGHVEVVSQVGVGSTFSIVLPLTAT